MEVKMRHILAALLVITVALAGCSRNKPQPSDPLLASRWLLTAFTDADGRHAVPTDPIPYLEVSEETLYFHNGCNGVGSSWHMEDSQIAVERSVIRGVGCDPHFDAAEALLDAVADSMAGWSAYTLPGDELILPFDGGEIRFSRALPDNAAGLRAFPLQRATEEQVRSERGLIRGQLDLVAGCLRVMDMQGRREASDLILWPANAAVGFDGKGVNVWRWAGSEVVRLGDEVVMSGGRIDEIEPLLDADFLWLDSIPDTCPGPYWVVEDGLPLDE